MFLYDYTVEQVDGYSFTVMKVIMNFVDTGNNNVDGNCCKNKENILDQNGEIKKFTHILYIDADKYDFDTVLEKYVGDVEKNGIKLNRIICL